ncbi:7-cyano-7-deazaguanine synthase QueC [Clostridium disporicum]|uniref:7-cyano-7-deazaguanine synthase n=1 Tax=Clostridium disporicum TaxID=84024 RepID=A0A174EPU1_9CLOT|nr:7-cyano-7-deazaguanine synthase QueC [Clostridium disporicum]CUO38606.1 7-cyano-7-deazaguanine synthase [Clostridium disporicum]
MKKNKAIVVLSGGQDSTTCLFWAKKNFDEVIAVSFNYNQRNLDELDCAKVTCEKNNIEHHILDLSLLNQLTSNALTRDEISVQAKKDDGRVPNTFVDGRNLLFLSFVAVFAKQRGIQNIITGVSQSDYSGYPDCRDIFIKSLNTTLNLAMDYEFDIITPLMWIDKADTWKMADDLGIIDIIKNETITCYNGVKGNGCGNCPSCSLRKNGYKLYKEKYINNIK